jgi:hypothetical protein
MDLLHHPLLRDTVKTPQPRSARNSSRHPRHFLLSRLTPRPAAQLVLIGPPGTGKITLSNQIILIEAVEPGLHRNPALQSALNFISKAIRFAVQNLKSPAEANRKSFSENDSRICLREIDSGLDAPPHAPALQAITASADLWNFVTTENEFAGI